MKRLITGLAIATAALAAAAQGYPSKPLRLIGWRGRAPMPAR